MNFQRPTTAELRAGEAAAWGPPAHARPGLRLKRWRPVRKNTLRGFATVWLPISLHRGLTLVDCTVHVHPNGRTWVALPAKPELDQNGQQRHDINGKACWVALLHWDDRAMQDRFSAAVIELIRARHPEALD